MALKKDFKSGIYNLGTGKSLKVLEVCSIVEEVVKRSSEITNHLSKENKERKSTDFWASIERSKSNLIWEPKFSFKKGIIELQKIKWL